MQGIERPPATTRFWNIHITKRYTASRLLRWTEDGRTPNMLCLAPDARGHLQGGSPAQPGRDAGGGGQVVRADERGARARPAQEAPEQQRVGAGQEKHKHAAHLHVRQLTKLFQLG